MKGNIWHGASVKNSIWEDIPDLLKMLSNQVLILQLM